MPKREQWKLWLNPKRFNGTAVFRSIQIQRHCVVHPFGSIGFVTLLTQSNDLSRDKSRYNDGADASSLDPDWSDSDLGRSVKNDPKMVTWVEF